MKKPFCYLLFGSLMFILHCSGRKSSPDKYPDLPYLRNYSAEKYSIEKIEFQPISRIGDFLLQDAPIWQEDSLTVFDLSRGRAITFPIKGRRHYIDVLRGNIVTIQNDSLFFRYGLPEFNEEPLEFQYFQSCYDSVASRNAHLHETQVHIISDSIDNKKLRSEAVCVCLFWDRQHYLVRGVARDWVIQNPGIQVDLPECLHVMRSKFRYQYLKPFDVAVLGYERSGYHSNLFGHAIELYYYRYEFDESAIVFKDSSYSVSFFETPDNRAIILNGFEIFEIRRR